jgi:hypothetical protein
VVQTNADRALRRRARPSAAHTALLALVLVVLCARAAAPAGAEPAGGPTTSEGLSAVPDNVQIAAQSGDQPAGSGGAEGDEPSAWNGILGLLAWVLVATVAFGFLIWMAFVRPARRARAPDDDVPDRGPETP